MASAYQSSCRGPITKSAARFLFDHLVGEQQERLRDRQAKGLGAESEEKREPVSDIDTGVADSLKVLDPDGRLEKRT